ncbi:hypothetical protein SPRG_15645 [Saprolegnia parasitica CBS 223.65]|uniref:Uncharacterized protein n=1 Tax=Saprolegnia parasitica (strain CBS 223.65) TaxID=695850 RepID=A0A067BXD9_SAPPC|nr:hypothetical protein SPRG_15645 [Saprolegnia parasitica CBS 223.65]KDO19202.1 hypothetical protein SPRG_15645 [Saprolegnia parasitica CBS 223.65]|eukprot:XP_012210102.1 hypothetical protein SPRG_15645 [Saprolegnia parasitica CBS 223.65]
MNLNKHLQTNAASDALATALVPFGLSTTLRVANWAQAHLRKPRESTSRNETASIYSFKHADDRHCHVLLEQTVESPLAELIHATVHFDETLLGVSAPISHHTWAVGRQHAFELHSASVQWDLLSAVGLREPTFFLRHTTQIEASRGENAMYVTSATLASDIQVLLQAQTPVFALPRQLTPTVFGLALVPIKANATRLLLVGALPTKHAARFEVLGRTLLQKLTQSVVHWRFASYVAPTPVVPSDGIEFCTEVLCFNAVDHRRKCGLCLENICKACDGTPDTKRGACRPCMAKVASLVNDKDEQDKDTNRDGATPMTMTMTAQGQPDWLAYHDDLCSTLRPAPILDDTSDDDDDDCDDDHGPFTVGAPLQLLAIQRQRKQMRLDNCLFMVQDLCYGEDRHELTDDSESES